MVNGPTHHEQRKTQKGPKQSETNLEQGRPWAHCVTTGRWLQAIGLFMLLSGCCFWSLSGLILTPASRPAENWSDYLEGAHRSTALLTIDIVTTFVGGLGLCGTGLGLCERRRYAGIAAMCISGIMAVIYIATAVGFATLKAWLAALPVAALGLLCLALFFIAAHCASLLKRFPPPPYNPVTEEFLEKWRQERDQRRSQYDP